MIRGEDPNSRATPALRPAPSAAPVMVRAAVAALAGVAVSLAVAAVPALAAQQPGVTAASHTRAAGTGQQTPASPMNPGPGWTHVAAGFYHACAIRTGGTLWCWGDNIYGQLGTGSQTSQDRPRQVTGCTHPGTRPRPAPAPAVSPAGRPGRTGPVRGPRPRTRQRERRRPAHWGSSCRAERPASPTGRLRQADAGSVSWRFSRRACLQMVSSASPGHGVP
jgi:Regulator of chromosome condensation (RCC1) repeat